MNSSEKTILIDRFLAGADSFDDVLAMDPALLAFKPSMDAWSIHQHVVHFVESDIATFHRYRKALAEPGGPVVGYDEEKWTANLDYHETSLEDSLAILKLLRRVTAKHLRSIVNSDWAQLTYSHNVNGTVDLEAWIVSYIEHVSFHRTYIERNIKSFAKVRESKKEQSEKKGKKGS